MKNKVYFLLLFLATVTAAVLGGGYFSRFLLGFEFLLAITLLAYPRLIRRHVGITLCPPAPEAHRGEELALEARLENRSRLPVPEARVELRCRDEYDGTELPLRGAAMLDGRDRTALRFTLRAEHYALITVRGEKVRIGDPLGVNFTGLRFPERRWQIAVLPELMVTAGGRTTDGKAGNTAEDGAYAGGQGNDPDAAYELRKYQNYEPLRNMHWKMTAKTDELMVKDFGRDEEKMTVVFLDLDRAGKPYRREDWDLFLETVASFTARELSAGRSLRLVWLDDQAGLFGTRVHDAASAREAMTALLRMKPYSGAAGEMEYKEIRKHEAYNGTICIDLWGQIKREGAS